MARLASTYDPGHGGGCVSGQTVRRPAPRGVRQTGQNESPGSRRVTAALEGILTTPEICHLLSRLVLAIKNHPAFVWAWSRWRQKHQRLAARGIAFEIFR